MAKTEQFWKYRLFGKNEDNVSVNKDYLKYKFYDGFSKNIQITKNDKVELSFDNLSIYIIFRKRYITVEIYNENGDIVKTLSMETREKNITIDVSNLEEHQKYYCWLQFSDKDGNANYVFSMVLK